MNSYDAELEPVEGISHPNPKVLFTWEVHMNMGEHSITDGCPVYDSPDVLIKLMGKEVPVFLWLVPEDIYPVIEWHSEYEEGRYGFLEKMIDGNGNRVFWSEILPL